MARVDGPLFSLQAHGKLANSLVYTHSRGQNVVREHVIPRNPQTEMQAQGRTVVKVIGAMNSRINAGQVGKSNGASMTPLEYLKSVVVAPLVWNSELLKRGYPSSWTTLNADLVLYGALTQPEKDAWGTWNDAFANSFEDLPSAPGRTGMITANEIAHTFARALARAAYITVVPNQVPPTWDNS